MSILDIIEVSDTPEIASRRIAFALVKRQLEQTQRSIAETFSFSVTWGQGTLTAEQIERYQRLWNEFDRFIEEVKL